MGTRRESLELLPGTLDLLILKALTRGKMHGYSIVQMLKVHSDEVVQVGESSLYPALQRLLLNGWVAAEWGTSENNRRARYYTLTPAGRKQLASERADFERMIAAIQKVPATAWGGFHGEPVTPSWLLVSPFAIGCGTGRRDGVSPRSDWPASHGAVRPGLRGCSRGLD